MRSVSEREPAIRILVIVKIFVIVRKQIDHQFRIEEMRHLYKNMAAANFSRDVLEMFYGAILQED